MLRLSFDDLIVNEFGLVDMKTLFFGHGNRDLDHEDEEKKDLIDVKILFLMAFVLN